MKKYDLCVKSGTYTDRNGNSPYLLIKPYINFAGFPREEGRSHLIVSMFEHKEQEQRNSSNSCKEEFSADIQEYDPDKIPF